MLKPLDRQKTLEEQWQPNRPQKECVLDEIDALVDWEPILRRLEKMYRKDRGRPAIPPLGMFKLLLLEYFYDISDVRVVEELRDRRSFERFCGIDLLENEVDDTTLVKFRERLREANLTERLFDIFDKQIETKGLLIKKGTLVDSTLVRGAHRPGATGSDGAALDPDVAWTRRDGKPEHGMKVSLSVDEGSEIVRQVVLTPASVDDHTVFADLVLGDEKKLYADKGYASRKNRNILASLEIGNGILYKGCYRRKLRGWQVSLNKRNKRHRDNIERKFAEAKKRHGMEQLRYRGIERNWVQVVFTVVAMNLKRVVRLIKATKMRRIGAAVCP